jgi:hypothetical protein
MIRPMCVSVLATAWHGGWVAAGVWSDHIYSFQFRPWWHLHSWERREVVVALLGVWVLGLLLAAGAGRGRGLLSRALLGGAGGVVGLWLAALLWGTWAGYRPGYESGWTTGFEEWRDFASGERFLGLAVAGFGLAAAYAYGETVWSRERPFRWKNRIWAYVLAGALCYIGVAVAVGAVAPVFRRLPADRCVCLFRFGMAESVLLGASWGMAMFLSRVLQAWLREFRAAGGGIGAGDPIWRT